MMQYNPETYWDERLRKYGHTGWYDNLIYTYDQPLRLQAINKALKRANISLRNIKVLDIGCGTGDFVLYFAQHDVAEVVGVDISREVILYAKKRFSNFKNVKTMLSRVEEIEHEPNYFDLVTSVTVLQHITDKKAFEKAINNIVKLTKPKGKILILETAPINNKKSSLKSSSYHSIWTRREWIDSFERKGCYLVFEGVIPQFGIKLLRYCDLILGAIPLIPTLRYTIRIRSIVLKIAQPFDRLFLFSPFRNLSTLRILIFEKH